MDGISNGYKALDRTDLKRAYRFFIEASKIEKSDEMRYNALVGLSVTYREIGELDKALDTSKKAYEIFPDGIENLYNMGNFYEEMGNHVMAIQNYDKVTSLDPDNINANINRGVAHYNLENYEQAVRDFKNVLKIDPLCNIALTDIGICYLELDRYEDSIDYFDLALEEEPENIHALCGKGLALFYMDRYDESIICFNASISINEDFYIAYYYKGHILRKLELLQEAEETINQALEIREKYPLAWYELGEIYRSTDRIREAIHAYDKANRYNQSTFEKALYEKGRALLDKNRDFNGAILAFKNILKDNPYISDVWYQMGLALSNIKGGEDRAISALENSIHLNPDNVEAANLLGKLLHSKGDIEKAYSLLKRSMENNPSSETGTLLSVISYEMRNHKESIVWAEDTLSLDPSNYKVLLVMGRAYGKTGMKEEYKQCLRKYLHYNPEDEKIEKELESI